MSVEFSLSELAGLQVTTAQLDHLHSASIGVILPVGSRHESGHPQGISHFLEHMIFKGTTSRSASQLATQAEGAGITMNAYTTEDHTMLEMRGIADTLPLMVELCGDMLWHSTFEPTDISNEAAVIEEEIIGYEESPSEHVHDLLSQALWPNNPLGKPITGTIESIKEIDQAQLVQFRNRHYLAKGTCVAVAGDIEHQQVLDQLQQHFPDITKPAQENTCVAGDTPEEYREQRDIEQAHLAIGYKTAGRHSKDRHALRLISLMLGETMSSLLFQKIREELGLCYSIHSDFHLFEDVGSFNIIAALDGERYALARETIDSVIEDFATNGPTNEMLENARRYALVQNKLALEGSQPHMQWIADSVSCYNRIILPAEAETCLKAVTMDRIMEVAQATLIGGPRGLAAILPD